MHRVRLFKLWVCLLYVSAALFSRLLHNHADSLVHKNDCAACQSLKNTKSDAIVTAVVVEWIPCEQMLVYFQTVFVPVSFSPLTASRGPPETLA
jgi:hypothetical protein